MNPPAFFVLLLGLGPWLKSQYQIAHVIGDRDELRCKLKLFVDHIDDVALARFDILESEISKGIGLRVSNISVIVRDRDQRADRH